MDERDEVANRQDPKRGEGVRILRAEEAQAALDAGEAAGRRPEDELRFGDVPPTPPGPRPSHRFPLPDSVDPAEAVSLPPLAADPPDPPRRRHRPVPPPPPPVRRKPAELLTEPETSQDPGASSRVGADKEENVQLRKEDPVTSLEDRGSKRRSPAGSEPPATPSRPVALAPSGSDDRTTELAIGPVGDEPSLGSISLSGSAPEMLHWTDPPTGEVPRLSFDDDDDDEASSRRGGDAWTSLGGREAHWRDEQSWHEEDLLDDLAGDEPPVGALDSSRTEHSDLYSFDEDFERVRARGTSDPVIDLSDSADGGIASERRQTSPGRWGRTRSGAARRSQAVAPPLEDGLADEAEEPDAVMRGRSRRTTRPEPAGRRVAPRGGRSVDSNAVPPPRSGRPRPASGRSASRTGPGGAEPRDDLRGRVMIGAGLVVALIVAYAAGSKGLVVLAAVVCVLAAAEAYRMVQGAGFSPATLIGLVGTAGTVLAAYWKGPDGVVVVAGLAFAGTILWYVLGVVEARPLVNVAVTVMIYFWVGLLGAFSALMLRQPHGKGEFLGAVLVAVAADIAAYFVGRAVGSKPLAPAISPNKTLEGYLGGVIGAIIVGAIVGKALTPWGGMRHGLVLGLLVGLIAPAGDLFESLLKRDLQLKDSGTLLGGHGGVLDRFDSLLLALPAAYFVVVFFRL